jgi:hypothetical protein
MPNNLVIDNLDNQYFSKGFMYATIENTGETADGIAFGALQNISLSHEFGTVELRGPESLVALGAGFSESNLTGSAGWGIILPSQLKALLGGTVVYDAGTGKTTYTKKGEDQPKPFHLHCLSNEDADADDCFEVLLYNCLAPSVQVLDVGDTHAFLMRNTDFKVYGKRLGSDTTATQFKTIQTGNLTASNVSQPGNTNSNDIPATLEPDA